MVAGGRLQQQLERAAGHLFYIHTTTHTATAACTRARQLSQAMQRDLLDIPAYHMLFFHGRLSHAGVGYAMLHSRLHCYIGDRRLERVLTQEFLDQSDLVDHNASLSWVNNV